MQPQNELVILLNRELQSDLPEVTSTDDLKIKLAAFIQTLINSNFDRLVQILYKTDVDELKLKKILNTNHGADTAEIISDLILKREMEKIESRKKFRNENNNNDYEKW